MKERIFIPPPMQEIKLLIDQTQAFKRILILEDDPEVAGTLRTFLESKLLDVSFAKSAVFALREVMEGADFDVIICDIVKPQFSCQMFYVAVSRVKPHLCSRFIFTASHGAPTASLEFVKKASGMMLWQPFANHLLLETIQLVLQKRAQRKDSRTLAVETTSTPITIVPQQNTEAENLRLLQLSVSSATKSIRVISSHFLSDDATVKILKAARERNVEVELFVPRQKNNQVPDTTTLSGWAKLLDAGVKIFAMESANEHGRIIIGDDIWLCSTDSNFQIPNLNIYHGEFTARYLRNFEKQRKTFKPITNVPHPTTSPGPSPARTFVPPPPKNSSSEFLFKMKSLFAGGITPRA